MYEVIRNKDLLRYEIYKGSGAPRIITDRMLSDEEYMIHLLALLGPCLFGGNKDV